MALPTLIVRIAWATDLFADTPTWTTVTSDCLMFHIERGRQHELDRFEAGTATILFNNSSGDYWPDGADVDIGKKVSIQATYGSTYDLYTGYIESMEPEWLSGTGGLGPVMRIDCADAIAIFSRAALNEDPGYDQELSGTRIGNVLTTIGFPAADRDIDTGAFTMIASGILSNVKAQTHIFKVVESELGLFYMAGDGDAQFEDRSHRTESPHNASQATFNNTFVDIRLALDDKLLYNEVRATRSGGAEQTATNSASQTAYGLRSLERSGLFHTSDDITATYVLYLAARFAVPKLRAKSITIKPEKTPATLWPKALGYEISTRITVQHSAGSIDDDYFIEGIKHDYDSRKGEWITRWQLSDATRMFYPLDRREDTLEPTDVGDLDELVANAGGKVAAVLTNDGDTTYITRLPTAGWGYQLFELEDPVFSTGTVHDVTVYAVCRRTAAQNNPIRIQTKTHATVYESDDIYITTDYVAYSKEYTANPNTSDPWTLAEVIDLQAGIRLLYTGNPWFWEERCTQIYVVVDYTPEW